MLPLKLTKVVIMARKSERPSLVLTQEQRTTLQELSASRVAAAREVDRAKVMLGYAEPAKQQYQAGHAYRPFGVTGNRPS